MTLEWNGSSTQGTEPYNRPNSPIIALGKEVVGALCWFMLDLIPHPWALVWFLIKAKKFDPNRSLGDLILCWGLGAKLTHRSDLATCIKCCWGYLRDKKDWRTCLLPTMGWNHSLKLGGQDSIELLHQGNCCRHVWRGWSKYKVRRKRPLV